VDAERGKREPERVGEEVVDDARVPPRLEVLVVRGQPHVLDVVEVDCLKPLAAQVPAKSTTDFLPRLPWSATVSILSESGQRTRRAALDSRENRAIP